MILRQKESIEALVNPNPNIDKHYLIFTIKNVDFIGQLRVGLIKLLNKLNPSDNLYYSLELSNSDILISIRFDLSNNSEIKKFTNEYQKNKWEPITFAIDVLNKLSSYLNQNNIKYDDINYHLHIDKCKRSDYELKFLQSMMERYPRDYNERLTRPLIELIKGGVHCY